LASSNSVCATKQIGGNYLFFIFKIRYLLSYIPPVFLLRYCCHAVFRNVCQNKLSVHS
jgi:hypothetical protein